MTTRSVLDSQLVEIRDNLLRMGSLVDTAIDRAIRALEERDESLAQQIIADDKHLNHLRYEVENECLRVFATQQPMARDLRALIAAINLSVELERMGDHAEGIAKALAREGSDAVGDFVIDLPGMAQKTRAMLRLAMEAYQEQNVHKAREAAQMDDDLDKMYRSMFDTLIGAMRTGELKVSRGTYLMWGAHNLERIGDRITNICERVEFASTGSMEDLNP